MTRIVIEPFRALRQPWQLNRSVGFQPGDLLIVNAISDAYVEFHREGQKDRFMVATPEFARATARREAAEALPPQSSCRSQHW